MGNLPQPLLTMAEVPTRLTAVSRRDRLELPLKPSHKRIRWFSRAVYNRLGSATLPRDVLPTYQATDNQARCSTWRHAQGVVTARRSKLEPLGWGTVGAVISRIKLSGIF